MSKYLLLVANILLNISNSFSLKYYVPEQLCNYTISSIAIGNQVEYNHTKQPEILLYAEQGFWYYPNTDPNDVRRGWTQTFTRHSNIAAFRRNYFENQEECEAEDGSYDSIEREFVLINFVPNQVVYDIFNVSVKDYELRGEPLFNNRIFNQSKIDRNMKIDAALNWKQNIVIFQGENYFMIQLNESLMTCQDLRPQHFGPFKVSEIDSNLTSVTSALYDYSTGELYIFQSDQVFIYKAGINDGRISIETKQSNGNIKDLFFDCRRPPPIELPTEPTTDSSINESSDGTDSSASETSSDDMVSESTTKGGKKKGFVTMIVIAIIAVIIIALLICIFCVFCAKKGKEKSSEDKESEFTEEIESESYQKSKSSETLQHRSHSTDIHQNEDKTESFSLSAPNILGSNKEKEEKTDNDLENMQIRSTDDNDINVSTSVAPKAEQTDNTQSVKHGSLETENKDSDSKGKDNTPDSAQTSPDYLVFFESSPKSTDSKEAKSGSKTSLDSGDLEKPKSAESLHSIDSLETTEKDKPKPSEPKSDPNSKEFSKPDSSSSDSSNSSDNTSKDKPESKSSNKEQMKLPSDESLTDDTEIF